MQQIAPVTDCYEPETIIELVEDEKEDEEEKMSHKWEKQKKKMRI